MSLGIKSLFDVLQVTREADQETIEAAYKSLAKRYHPDLNKSPDAEKKMKEINEAYELLRDPVVRERYRAYVEQKEGSMFEDFLAKQDSQARADERAKAQAQPKAQAAPQPPPKPPPAQAKFTEKPKADAPHRAYKKSDGSLELALTLSVTTWVGYALMIYWIETGRLIGWAFVLVILLIYGGWGLLYQRDWRGALSVFVYQIISWEVNSRLEIPAIGGLMAIAINLFAIARVVKNNDESKAERGKDTDFLGIKSYWKRFAIIALASMLVVSPVLSYLYPYYAGIKYIVAR